MRGFNFPFASNSFLGRIKIIVFFVSNVLTVHWELWACLDGFEFDDFFWLIAETVYHSSSLLSNLSSTWTSKPPLAVKYRLDTGLLDEPGGPKSLCSTLERLMAWEKKLYEEVKVIFLA